MALRCACGILALLCLSNSLQSTFAQTQFQVGDEAGWTIPALANINYSTWAANHKYHVGDTLLFSYVGGIHNVVQVASQADYDNCNSDNAIAVHASGKTAVTLTKPGAYFFICGTPGHCALGQKFSLIATPVSAPSTSTPPELKDKPLDSLVPSSTPVVAQGPKSNAGRSYSSWIMLLAASSLCATVLV